ncbi:MAG: hypothetical protein Q9201_001624 [Fulgogasparrea decipioides]
MKGATASQLTPVQADPLGIADNTQVSNTRPSCTPTAGNIAVLTQQISSYQETARQTLAPGIQRHLNVPQSRYTQRQELDKSPNALASQIAGQERPRRKPPGQPFDKPPSRAAPKPPTEPQMSTAHCESLARIALKNILVKDISQTPWYEYEIPSELEIIQPNLPDEIKNIIQESLDEQRALILSSLQEPAVVREAVIVGKIQRDNAESMVAESSAMAANRHPGSSTYSIGAESIYFSLTSSTSLGSSDVEDGLLKNTVERNGLESRSSEENQRSDVYTAIGKLQKSRGKLSKAHGMFKMLRRPKNALACADIKVESETHECTSCFDDVPNKEAIVVPCRHRYCAPCFSQLIAIALQSEDHFPPKCCLQEIPGGVLRKHLPANELASFDNKALEYSVAIGSRYYCARPECAKWIDTKKAKSRNGALECPHCRYKLCTLCRGPKHPTGQDCPQDFGLDATLQQAERAGWQRCYNCRAMVELNTGCRHITCKCKAEFCYTCGARWRTCACTEEDQARRARQIRENLEKLEAEARAEEEEIRAAIATVEAAERQAAEERAEEERRQEEERAEEARQISMRELQRVQNIVQHTNHLRDILENIRLHQESALTQRHESQMETLEKRHLDLASPETIAEKQRATESRRAEIINATDTAIQELRKKHATELVQIRSRHRQDEDDFLLNITQLSSYPSPTPLSDGGNNHTPADPASMHEALLSDQELERSALRSMQARQVETRKKRGLFYLQVFSEECVRDAKKWEREREDGRTRWEDEVRGCKRAQWAESRWMRVVWEKRLEMLEEDERRMIRNGGEVSTDKVEEGKNGRKRVLGATYA